MPTISKIGPKLALCGIVSGLFLIGWAARNSVAQAPNHVKPPLQLPPASPSEKPAETKVAAPQDSPDTRSELAPPLPEPGPASAVAVPRLNGQAAPDLRDVHADAPVAGSRRSRPFVGRTRRSGKRCQRLRRGKPEACRSPAQEPERRG